MKRAAWLMGLLAAAPALAAQADLVVNTVQLPELNSLLYLRDADGDGDLDLWRVDEQGVNVALLGADGRFGPESQLPWPDAHLGWQLVDADANGTYDLALLIGGRRMLVHRVGADGSFDAGQQVFDDARGSLPRGQSRVPFVRDVDGDGVPDAVLPGAGIYRIHLLGGEQRVVNVQMNAKVSTDVGDPTDLDAHFRQEVSIPLFRIDDLDGDGQDDLVTETDDEVIFHLSLSSEPSWRIDLAALRDEMGEVPLDLDNLLGSVTHRVTWRVVDIDGQVPNDLIISQAGTFRVWRDGSRGEIQRPPDLLLKSSGNVLHYLVRDVTNDGAPDLQIIRGDVISIGQVARLLVVPGALDFDVFTYRNEGGSFEKRPSRRSTVRLEIPRLLAFYDELEEMQEELKARFRSQTSRACLDGDGAFDDVVDWADGELRLYRGLVPANWKETLVERVQDTSLDGLLETFVLSKLDAMEDGSVWPIDLQQIKQLRLTPGWELQQLARAQSPWQTLVTPWPPGEEVTIEIVDLDSDGRSDIVLRGELGLPADEDGATGPKIEVLQIVLVRPRAD